MNTADPGLGFPPGTPMQGTGLSTHGLLHFVFGRAVVAIFLAWAWLALLNLKLRREVAGI